jgi:outer membrane protein assembly factor BamB
MRQPTTLRLFLLLALAASPLLVLGEDKVEPTPKKEPPKIPVDITTQAREWNSDKFEAPRTTFRKGHVTARLLPAEALGKTDLGFVIQFPSKAPIASPTVYQGKIYLGGGFRSKEFYCVDAQTGKLVWGVTLDDDGPSSAVVEDGICVFNTESCTIFALDAKTGKQLWSYWLGDPLTSTPTIANGIVFTSYPAAGGGPGGSTAPNAGQGNPFGPPEAKAGKDKPGKTAPPCSHILAAFDLKSGKILWQRWIDSDVMSAPVAVDDELYATSFAGVVYRFNQKDGKLLSALRRRATSAPVVVGKKVYWTERAEQGKEAAQEAIAANHRLDSKAIYQANKRRAVYLDIQVQRAAKLAEVGAANDAANGFAGGAPAAANPLAAASNVGQASVSTMQAFQGSRLLHVDNRNINCMGDRVYCTDPKTGKELWNFKLSGDLKKEGGFLAAPPAAAGGQLFLTTLKGEVLQIDPEKGKLVKTYPVGSPIRQQAAIVAGRIFVTTVDGKVVVIDTKNEKLTGWNTWGGNSAHTGVAQAK